MSKDKKKFTKKRLPKKEPVPVVEEKPKEEIVIKKSALVPSYRQIWQTVQLEREEDLEQFCKVIDFHWAGYRKDTKQGKIWGYFTLKEKPYVDYSGREYYMHPAKCFVFFGQIGGNLTIEEKAEENIGQEVLGRKANFKEMGVDKLVKIINSWSQFGDEIGMFLTYRKLRK